MESKGKPEIPRSLEDWRPALVAFFRRRVGSFEEAEDLAHDTLLRLVVRDADAECYNDGYVFTVAQNLLHDRNRKAAVRARHSDARVIENKRLTSIQSARCRGARNSLAF